MSFTCAYRKAAKDYDRKWRTTDKTLYDLCRRFPGHGDRGQVNAKLCIIGRTYATRIESMIPSDGKQGSSMSKLAQHLHKCAGKADALFTQLRQVQLPLNPGKLSTIVAVHGQFIALIQPVLRPNQSPRSFTSKYMHFHCPTVPIIDRFADAALRRLVHWRKSFCLPDLPKDVDGYYAKYASRFGQLYQQACDSGLKPRVKYLDWYLLHASGATARE